MLTRRELAALAVCLLCALAALLLGGCAAKPVQKELPHYPCTRQEGGKTVYFKCPALEWVEQQGSRK